MRIVFFGNAPETFAGVRYRILKFADMLRADGYVCVVCLPSSPSLYQRWWDKGSKVTKLLYLLWSTTRRFMQLRFVMGADVVIFRGPVMINGYGPPIIERLARLLNPRLVFDIDDAIWEDPDGVNSFFLRFVDHNWTWKMCSLCRHAVVGNRYLYGHVAATGIAVTIIPTCIDETAHQQKEYLARRAGPVVLGWAGLHTNLVHLDSIADVLRQLARKHDILLSVASGRPYELDGVPIVNHRWVLSSAIEYHRDADIGLMPLRRTPCSVGKCAFKALQYMGVGTPCVISSVGMNSEVVSDGVNGFLADTAEEWYAKLERLIVDPALREKMGRSARDTVMERYTHAVNYPKLLNVIHMVARADYERST